MTKITFFDSFEEMIDAMVKAQEQADSTVRPAQAEIKPGQHYINNKIEYGFAIFGEILDITELGTDPDEQKYINDTYSQKHMKYYKPSRAYSVACPMGEVGDVHLSEIDAIIDSELFDWYKQHGWTKPR